MKTVFILLVFMSSCSGLAFPQSTRIDQQLLTESRNGRLERVIQLLDQGADINARNSRGNTPLVEAIERRHYPVVELLLSRGAEICGTALHRVGVRGDRDLILLVLENTKNTPEIGEPGLLHAAFLGRTEAVELFVQHGVHIDCLHPDRGTTPLMEACSQARVETVKLLLDLGADPNIRTEGGLGAMQFIMSSEEASDSQRQEILTLIGLAGARD